MPAARPDAIHDSVRHPAPERRGRPARHARPRGRDRLGYLGRILAAFALVTIGAMVPAPAAFADTAPVETNYSLPDAYVGVPYSAQLEPVGGVAPYTWHFVGGLGCPLPDGLAVSTSGLVSGTPTSAVGYCLMYMSLVDHSPTGGTYHAVSVAVTVQAAMPTCTAADLVTAFDAAEDGSVVTVCDGLDLSGLPLTVPTGRDITLDLAGRTLTANGAGSVPGLTIPAGSSLTVVDTHWGATGTATFDGISDDGVLALAATARVTSSGAIAGTGRITGVKSSPGAGSPIVSGILTNNGTISPTVTVDNVLVYGHNYYVVIYQNDGTGRILGTPSDIYAATLGDVGISIARDWSARDRDGYSFTGWYLDAPGAGDVLTDTTDFSQGGTVMARGSEVVVSVYAGWSPVPDDDSTSADDGNTGGSASDGSGGSASDGSGGDAGGAGAGSEGSGSDGTGSGGAGSGSADAGDSGAVRTGSAGDSSTVTASPAPSAGADPASTAAVGVLGTSAQMAAPNAVKAPGKAGAAMGAATAGRADALAETGFRPAPAVLAAVELLLAGLALMITAGRRWHDRNEDSDHRDIPRGELG